MSSAHPNGDNVTVGSDHHRNNDANHGRATCEHGYKRCVIYTRKSSEEGLDQDFNSLHAQREACEAYVQSQRHEGWRLLQDSAHHYDDGGLSGGNMERPGLQRMLSAIEGGQIDVIVVYKVDRLTRSLADFARIVDVMDRFGVSFVSVTQAFNTTSSMGRLTLNVLLSFAQFEREVTAERIRDKIAASKRKGIWMGGPVPIGYRALDRRLVIDTDEAPIVRTIFETYRRTHSLHATKAELDQAGIVTRRRVRKNGDPIGGVPLSASALSSILRNPVYIGKITHKGELHEGQHKPLIDTAMFEAVQKQLDVASGGNKPRQRKTGTSNTKTKSKGTSTLTSGRLLTGRLLTGRLLTGRLLTGRLYDRGGYLMSPTHTNKCGVRYRYYVSTALARHEATATSRPHRISAVKIETALTAEIERLLANESIKPLEPTSNHPFDIISRVDLTATGADITFKPDAKLGTNREIGAGTGTGTGTPRETKVETRDRTKSDRHHVPIDWHKPIRCERRSPAKNSAEAQSERLAARKIKANTSLLQAIAKANRRYGLIKSGRIGSIAELANSEGCSVRSVRLTLPLAWLAPDVVQAAIDNRLDPSISATALARTISPNWQEQRHLLNLAGEQS